MIEEISTIENQLQIFNNQSANNITEDFQKIMESKDKRIKELEDKLNLEEKNKNEIVKPIKDFQSFHFIHQSSL